MINILKKIINYSPFLKKLLLPIYLLAGSLIYWIYKKFDLPFSYKLVDKRNVKFYPNGQIALGIFLCGFEKKELEIFQLSLKNGSVMIDAGANIGLYSIIGSRIVGESGKVFSFEPSKANFNLFLKNIELNAIKNITPINMGLGNTIGESLILSQNFETGDAEKYILKVENKIERPGNKLNGIQTTETISLDTLDNFQIKNSITKVDFLKIDVEGFEFYVLKGAEKLLRDNPDIIILFECADHLAKRAGSSQKEVFTFLGNLGIDIVYWNEKDKNWSNDLSEGLNSGQLIGGRNIMATLNNLGRDKSNNVIRSNKIHRPSSN